MSDHVRILAVLYIVFGTLGLLGALVILLIFGGIAGIGLLQFQSWARMVAIILSALNIMNVPFGTALGIYGLWVLLHQESERLFGARAA